MVCLGKYTAGTFNSQRNIFLLRKLKLKRAPLLYTTAICWLCIAASHCCLTLLPLTDASHRRLSRPPLTAASHCRFSPLPPTAASHCCLSLLPHRRLSPPPLTAASHRCLTPLPRTAASHRCLTLLPHTAVSHCSLYPSVTDVLLSVDVLCHILNLKFIVINTNSLAPDHHALTSSWRQQFFYFMSVLTLCQLWRMLSIMLSNHFRCQFVDISICYDFLVVAYGNSVL